MIPQVFTLRAQLRAARRRGGRLLTERGRIWLGIAATYVLAGLGAAFLIFAFSGPPPH